MKRTDIEIIQKKDSTTVKSRCNQVTFSRNVIRLFSTARLTAAMLDEMESSGIVTVEECNFEKGLALLTPGSFYDPEKFAGVITALFEKYNL
jgi:hypothetical protein